MTAAPDAFPGKRFRASRDGASLSQFTVRVEVVTPILGGGPGLRELDEVEVIRAATVRGHLRFWWRALHAHEFRSSEGLYEAESALWGRAAGDGRARSLVEVRVDGVEPADIDDGEIRLYDSRAGKASPGAYALWPARGDKKGTPTAQRRKPGTHFHLTILGPEDKEADLRNVVRAWLLFGGYGSRTRRGLGSLTVVDDSSAWLPAKPTREELAGLFGVDVFGTSGAPAGDTPRLAGAALHVGNASTDAVTAWTAAVDWLKEFRQGTDGPPRGRAREPGAGKPQPKRPSISNWPEADKVRHLTERTSAHPPRYNAVPAWPRAGFGLPIVGRFQTNARDGGRLDEPDGFELRWRSPRPAKAEEWEEHDRLASPLIVKAMPLADGAFVPIALWLNRAHPSGEVILRGVEGSAAPFDRLVAPNDTPKFAALEGKSSLREAFLDWLRARRATQVIAP